MATPREAPAAIERSRRQLEIPGAGPASSAAIARRRAAAPLKPGVPQAPCDVGLFGDTHRQTDLLDLVRK